MIRHDIEKKLPKIVHFIWWIPHYRVPIFRRLSQNPGMHFIVCAGNNPQSWGGGKIASAADLNKAEDINWHEVKSVRIQTPPFRWYEWQPGAIKFVVQQKPDAVICLGGQSFSNMVIRLYCRLKRIPVLEWAHGLLAPESGLKWFLRKAFFRLPNALLFYGNGARKFFSGHGFDKDKLFVVYNSLDYDEQVRVRSSISKDEVREIRENFGLTGPQDRLLFHTGRLQKKYNLPFLFDALKVLKQKGKRIFLVLVGDGPEENALREKARLNDVADRVIFYGACYDENILGRVISSSDICVVTGAIGLTAMHSLVYGVPVLTASPETCLHCPEIEAVVDGKTGGFFKYGNLGELVAKIESMLYPVSCKESMMKQCIEMIDRHYTPEYQEKVIIEALNSVLPSDKQIPP